jgi:hypothetical protein
MASIVIFMAAPMKMHPTAFDMCVFPWHRNRNLLREKTGFIIRKKGTRIYADDFALFSGIHAERRFTWNGLTDSTMASDANHPNAANPMTAVDSAQSAARDGW